MRGYILIIGLMTVFFSTAVFSQEFDEGADRPGEDIKHEMHIRNMQLELEEREAELDFGRRMRELELEERRIGLERKERAQKHPHGSKRCHKGKMLPFLIVCFVIHILLAVWVYQDIRKRGTGSGIWIVIVLLAGLLGVLPYAIIRLGDIRETKS